MGDEEKLGREASRRKTTAPKVRGAQTKATSQTPTQAQDSIKRGSKKGAAGAKTSASEVGATARKGSSRGKNKTVSVPSSPDGGARALIPISSGSITISSNKPSKSPVCSSPRELSSTSPISPRQPPLSRRCKSLRDVANGVRLRADEISRAVEDVNPLIGDVIRRIKEHPMFAEIERLPTGSYYEKVKVSKPDEFDIMLKIPIGRIKLEPFDEGGAFYRVSFERNTNEKKFKSCVADGWLSATSMLETLRSQIKKICSEGKEISMKRKQTGCPAITLLIKKPEGEISVDIVLALEVRTSWPASTKAGLNITEWLGTKVRQDYRRFEPFYLVAKSAKDEHMIKDTWRLSFSNIEKDILKRHGNKKTCCEKDGQKCCRKICLKLLKHLLEKLKNEHRQKLDKFCSYHVKNIAFHAFSTYPQDDQWKLEDLQTCFDVLIDMFLCHLKDEKLTHFFIPSFNLFCPEFIETRSLRFLSEMITFQKSNKFPIFNH
ncbi:cyclic GMP-AMP synthase isoform X2 [Pleurodeles waltl]|uniref:cyclic GMP-AMP synthase isoform X2 n=1 Tax=Pleurodeles waltl TaxID=8319 RepID=UPI00370990A0